MSDYIDIVFDGPPSHTMPRLVEVEDRYGKSVKVGEWVERGGYNVLRIPLGMKDADILQLVRSCLFGGVIPAAVMSGELAAGMAAIVGELKAVLVERDSRRVGDGR